MKTLLAVVGILYLIGCLWLAVEIVIAKTRD